MKSLIAATVLTFSTNAALALEIYGDFAGPDNSPAFDTTHGIEFGLRAPSAADFEVSLYGLLAGNPDSDNRPVPGYVPISDPTAPRYTSLDWLTFGNPDSGTGVRIETRPSVEIGNIVPAASKGGDSGA